MRQYIKGIPDELIEAVKLDGASEARDLRPDHPAADGSCPGDAGNLRLLWHWNDFLWR